MNKKTKECYISGKIIGIIYLAIAIFIVALVISYIRVDILQKGMYYAWDYVKMFCVILPVIIFQFLRWFFYSFYTDDKTITIRKLGRCIEFKKADVTSVYGIDFIGTIIEYNNKKVTIPTGKRAFFEKLWGEGIGFSDDVFFSRMRKKGYITVRPKWYALLLRIFLFGMAIIFFIGGIRGIKEYIDGIRYIQPGMTVIEFVFFIMSIYGIWWFNRSFVYINEDYIWQGLLFPRTKYSWKEFNRAKLRIIRLKGVHIEILKLYFKDSKKKISISFEDYVLNTEDLQYLLKIHGIPEDIE